MKKLMAIIVAIVASVSMTASAQAANEAPVGTTNVTPISGQFFQAKGLPANLTIRADVNTPPSSQMAVPLKNVKFTFPAGVQFNPNNKKTPACGALTGQSPLGIPASIVALCPTSIVGTGTAQILLAGANTDLTRRHAFLIIFNDGRDKQGRPKIKIYGYSEATKVGTLMFGTLNKGVLDVSVPVLSSDSAVAWFQFDLPGPVLDEPNVGVKVQGLDPSYALGVCPASGKLLTKSQFVLGKRDPNSGLDVGDPPVTLTSPNQTQDCTPGRVGKPKLKVTVKGPKSVKRGKKGTFKVTVANSGTGVAKGVKITGTGGAKGNGGNINPDASKTVTVKAKVTGRKGSSRTLTFTAKGGATAKGKIKVRVK